MSALPPKADACGANRQVCFGPIADMRAGLVFACNNRPAKEAGQ